MDEMCIPVVLDDIKNIMSTSLIDAIKNRKCMQSIYQSESQVHFKA